MGDPRAGLRVGQKVDRSEGLRVGPTVDLKGDLRVDQMVVRWVGRMAGLRVDPEEGHSVAMKGEAKADWLPSQQEEKGARPVLLPRAVQQGLVRLVG